MPQNYYIVCCKKNIQRCPVISYCGFTFVKTWMLMLMFNSWCFQNMFLDSSAFSPSVHALVSLAELSVCTAVIQIPPCKFNKLFVFCINAAVEFKCPLYCDSQATFRLFHFYCDLPNPLGPEYLSQTNLDRCGFVFRVAFMQNSPKKFIQNSLPFLNKFTNQYLKWNRNNVKFGKFLLYLIYTISL